MRCDPLGPDNPLIFATGYFSGTVLTTSNRLSIGAKSPLTGGIKESNSGGNVARAMTDQGVKLIMFQGQSEDWVSLYIDPEGKAQLLDAAETAVADGFRYTFTTPSLSPFGVGYTVDFYFNGFFRDREKSAYGY